jgi:flagellar biosynthesis protein
MVDRYPNDDETSARENAPPVSITKAVALEYDKAHDSAPRVTASGRGVIAEQILAIAFARGIKVRSDADLVEILEKIEVDSPIPLEAFAAVAEILAYVYKANAAMKQRKAQNMHRE